jgi:hypothetical protein
MSISAFATTTHERDFVCVGCGHPFPASTPSRFVKHEAIGRERLLVFHSVDCLIGWERQGAVPVRHAPRRVRRQSTPNTMMTAAGSVMNTTAR